MTQNQSLAKPSNYPEEGDHLTLPDDPVRQVAAYGAWRAALGSGLSLIRWNGATHRAPGGFFALTGANHALRLLLDPIVRV
jgi:hypothetical protein